MERIKKEREKKSPSNRENTQERTSWGCFGPSSDESSVKIIYHQMSPPHNHTPLVMQMCSPRQRLNRVANYSTKHSFALTQRCCLFEEEEYGKQHKCNVSLWPSRFRESETIRQNSGNTFKSVIDIMKIHIIHHRHLNKYFWVNKFLARSEGEFPFRGALITVAGV